MKQQESGDKHLFIARMQDEKNIKVISFVRRTQLHCKCTILYDYCRRSWHILVTKILIHTQLQPHVCVKQQKDKIYCGPSDFTRNIVAVWVENVLTVIVFKICENTV